MTLSGAAVIGRPKISTRVKNQGQWCTCAGERYRLRVGIIICSHSQTSVEWACSCSGKHSSKVKMFVHVYNMNKHLNNMTFLHDIKTIRIVCVCMHVCMYVRVCVYACVCPRAEDTQLREYKSKFDVAMPSKCQLS